MTPRSPRTGPQREGHRRARTILQDLGSEIMSLRGSCGLSIRKVAAIAGISPSTLAGIEDGSHSPSIEILARVAAALGGSLGVRIFPGTGPRVRDHLQATMLQALLGILHERWIRRLEVQVHEPARGLIDLVLEDRLEPTIVACEAHSQLRRLEQQLRWATMKADALAAERAAPAARSPETAAVVSRLLLLRSTQANRHVVSEFGELLETAYPAKHADLIDALTGDASWPGSGIVWCRVDADDSRILERPPRGIRLGR